MLKRSILFLISLYQASFSPTTGIIQWGFIAGGCRFHPTCSEYAHQMIEKEGIIRGIRAGLRQISKCHGFRIPNI